MTTRDSMQELQALRAQLQQLERDHPGTLDAVGQPALQASGASSQGEPDDLRVWLERLQEVEGDELLQRIREEARQWLGELDRDLHEMEPSTIFALFGLGVLVGRLTK